MRRQPTVNRSNDRMNSPYSSILSSISVIATSNAGDRGETGSIVSKTGVSSEGPSGDSKISSGVLRCGQPIEGVVIVFISV